MTRVLSEDDLEELIEGWKYSCPNPDCGNRTFSINTETQSALFVSTDENGEDKYLTVRVLTCNRCHTPLVVGTNTYRDDVVEWEAHGTTMLRSDIEMYATASLDPNSFPPSYPKEFIAFTEPIQERKLPSKVSRKIKESFREAEYAVSKNKPISAAATIRNTIRLLVEDQKIKDESLKDAIKKLPFSKEYLTALGNMKIMGDDALHHDGYPMSDLKRAVDVLYLALTDYYAHKDLLDELHKAVSNKASQKAKQAKTER